MQINIFNLIKNFFSTFKRQRLCFQNNYFIALRLFNNRYYVLSLIHLLLSLFSGDFSYLALTYEEFLQLIHLQNIPVPPLFFNNPLDDKAVGVLSIGIGIFLIIWTFLGCPLPSISEVITERPDVSPTDKPDVFPIEEKSKDSYTFLDIKVQSNKNSKNIDSSIKNFEERSDLAAKASREIKEQYEAKVSKAKSDWMAVRKILHQTEKERLKAQNAFDNNFTAKQNVIRDLNEAKNVLNDTVTDLNNLQKILFTESKIRKYGYEALQQEYDFSKQILLNDPVLQDAEVNYKRARKVLKVLSKQLRKDKLVCNEQAAIANSLRWIKKQKLLEYQLAESKTVPYTVKIFKSIREFFSR